MHSFEFSSRGICRNALDKSIREKIWLPRSPSNISSTLRVVEAACLRKGFTVTLKSPHIRGSPFDFNGVTIGVPQELEDTGERIWSRTNSCRLFSTAPRRCNAIGLALQKTGDPVVSSLTGGTRIPPLFLAHSLMRLVISAGRVEEVAEVVELKTTFTFSCFKPSRPRTDGPCSVTTILSRADCPDSPRAATLTSPSTGRVWPDTPVMTIVLG